MSRLCSPGIWRTWLARSSDASIWCIVRRADSRVARTSSFDSMFVNMGSCVGSRERILFDMMDMSAIAEIRLGFFFLRTDRDALLANSARWRTIPVKPVRLSEWMASFSARVAAKDLASEPVASLPSIFALRTLSRRSICMVCNDLRRVKTPPSCAYLSSCLRILQAKDRRYG